jgi:hypothetical protein
MSGSKVIITADASQGIREFDRFRAEATGALQGISNLSGKLKGVLAGVVAGLSINAFTGMVDSAVEAAAGMHDLSIQTGASVASLMAFKSVASTSETTIDGIGTAMNKLAKGMAVSTEESAGMGQAIKAIGLDFGTLKSMKPDQQMLEVAKALDQFQDGAGKSAVAMTLFGKEGAKMLPFLGDLAGEAEAVTAKLTEQQVQAKAATAAMADDFSDNLTKIKKEGQSWKKDIAMGMLPALYELSTAFYDVTTGASGMKGEIGQLSQDGTFADWTRVAITGVTYLSDAVQVVARVVKGTGMVIGAALAQVMSSVTGVSGALSHLVHGEYSQAWDTMKGMVREQAQIQSDAVADLGAMFTEQSFGSKLRERMDQIRQAGTAAKEAKKSLDFNGNVDGSAAAAVKKEAEAYVGLISSIRAKSDENRLELATDAAATEGQKLRIKIDQELASGKLKLSDAHLAVVRAALGELDTTEELVKAQKAEKDSMTWMQQSAQARNASSAALQVEYEMYGKTGDAREVAMVAIKGETDLEKFLQDERSKGIVIGEELEAQLRAEKDMRVAVEQATLAQTKALGYANQLAQDNRRFAADAIVDEKARATALLQIDAEMWRERIQLAGEGTEAQKALQAEFDVWYRNQSMKPQLDEQKKMWGSIEQTAHDTFVSIFDSGKSAFDRLRDTLKNGLLDLLYQMTVKKWIISLQASMTGSGAIASNGGTGDLFASAAGSSGGSVGSLISMANTAKNLYGSVSGGLSGMGASLASNIGSGVESVGSFFGSSNMTTFGQGMQGFGLDGSLGGLSGAGQSAGAMLGSAASIFGGVAGGVLGGRAISGGYGSNGAVNTGTAIGAAVGSIVPVIGTALGALVGGLLGGAYNRMFGRKAPEIQSQGLRGTFADGAVSGETYQNIIEKGGWFKSDKKYTESQKLTDDTIKQFTEGFDSIKSVSAGFAASLGVSADALKDYSKTFDITLTKDEEKNKQAITDFFTGVGEEVARKLVPGLDALTKSGETAAAALQRLAGEFQATDQVAQLLGTSAEKLFGAAGLQSAAAREQLIDAAGGVSALGQKATFFNQNFLTEAERIKPVAEALDKALASMSLGTIPTTRAQFKGLVDDLIASGAAATKEGADRLNSLLSVAEAFALVHPAAEAAADGAADAAKALQDIKDAAGTLLGGVDSAYAVLQRVVDREKAAVQSSVDAHSEAVSRLQGLSQSLRGSLDGMKSPDQQAMERAAAQAQIRAALAIAKAGGPLPGADDLKDALSAVSQDASSRFSTYADYLRDLYQTQSDMQQLADLTDDSLTVEERALKAAQDQLKSLDDMLAGQQEIVDELKGINTNGLTLAQAMAALAGAIGGAKSNPIVSATGAINSAYQSALGRAPDASGLEYWQNLAAGGTPISQIVDGITNSTEGELNRLYQSVLGRAPDAAGLAFWTQAFGPTMDADERAEFITGAKSELRGRGIPGFREGGMFGGGLRWVGEDGPELEATGPARIWSSSQTADILQRASSPAANSEVLVSAVNRLNATVALQQAVIERQEAALKSIAVSTMEVKDRLVKFDVIGMPPVRKE